MNPDPTAAAVCIACNARPAAAGARVCDVCRERAAAASAQMAEAKRLADEAAAANRAPKKAAKSSRAKREAAEAGVALTRVLDVLLPKDRVELGPAAPTGPEAEAVAAISRAMDEVENPPPPPERVRIRVRATPPPMTNPPTGRGPKTCCQCNQPYGERPDPDDAAIRCGECVRANRAAIRNFTRGR